MRRLVVPVWFVALLATAAWLRQLPVGDDAAFGAARSLALAASCYLVAATALNLALATTRVRFRLPLVPMLIAVSLASPLAGTPAFAAAPPTPSAAPPVMHRLPGAGDAPTSTTPTSTTPTFTTPTSTTTTPTTRARPTASPSAPAPAAAHTWVVRHGQCFWTIARHVTQARLGRTPTNAEIAAYWRPLIDANRARLVRPSDPGLLFAGQELVIPLA
jgi:hypothetical protein